MIRIFCILISIGIFLFYSSFKSNGTEKVENVLEKIEHLIENENYNLLFELVKDQAFIEKWKALNCYERGKISHLLGKVFYINNHELEAISYFKKAVYDDWKHCSMVSKKEMANTIYNIGVCYQYTDQIALGKFYIDTSLTLIEEIKDYPKADLAQKYQGAGSYYADLRDFTRAETYLNNALRHADSISLVDAYYMHIDLLSLYIKFKKFDKANEIIDLTDQKYLKNNALNEVDKSIFYLNCAEVYLRMGALEKAELICKKAIKLLPKEEINFISNAYEILGVIYYKKKAYDLSEEYYTKAYQLRLDENNIVQANVAKSFALENLSELEMASGHNEMALSKINEAINLNSVGLTIDKMGNPILKNFEISNGFHLLRQLGLKEKIIYNQHKQNARQNALLNCLELHFKMDSLIDNVLTNAYLDQAKLELLDNMSNHSSRAVDVSLELYRSSGSFFFFDKAFYFSSRSKAVLLQKLIASNHHLANLASDSIKTEYIKLKNTLNDVQRNLQQESGNRDSLLNAFSSIQLKFARFESKYLPKSDILKNSKYHTSLASLQKHIDEHTLLLDFFNGEESMVLFAVSKKHFSFRTIDRKMLDSMMITLKRQCTDPLTNFNQSLSKQVYKIMFDSIPNQVLKDIYSLVIVPDGQMHGFPIETLIDEKDQYILQKWDCKYSYVVSYDDTEKKTSKFSDEFVGFATSYSTQLNEHLAQKGLSDSLNRLNNLAMAEQELNTCVQKFDGKSYYGKEATIDQFYKNALNAKIVYLSLHSIVDKEDGARSSIVFDDRNREFLLRAYELHKQPMLSELVVLSACHTADGKWQVGEGINGITRAFLASGVRNIVSSLWAASEGSSTQLLPNFLQKYKDGEQASISLQKAKIEYLDKASPQLRHPFYWANYLLITNIDHTTTTEKSVSLIYWLCGLFSIILIILTLMIRSKRK